MEQTEEAESKLPIYTLTLIEIITASLSAVASVTTIIANVMASGAHERSAYLQGEITRISSLLSEVEVRLRQISPNSDGDSEHLLPAYSALLNALRESQPYHENLVFRPTNYGTWMLVRRKKIILRDPEGEYHDMQ